MPRDAAVRRPTYVQPSNRGKGWVLRRTLYSSLVVIAGVTLAFVAVAITLAFNG